MTRVSAERSRSSLATVDPPPPGIRTSTSATSGRWRSASSIASHASSATPIKSREASRSMRSISASRISGSSSATSTRTRSNDTSSLPTS